jgi:phosphomevalonate kinase
LIVDASELQRDRIKIGLGSSAAAAAATAAAAYAALGRDLAEPATLREVFACALEGHASVAPQGSGVDVAASIHGGFLRFVRKGDAIESRPLRLPKGLQIRLVWTGHAARTSDLLSQVHALRRNDPERYSVCMERLSELSGEFASAFEADRPETILATAASFSTAMGALGEAAGAPILEARLRHAAELAARFSGAAKPSGAGGGDVAIAFFLDASAARGFELACKDEGLHPIDVSWGAPGVRAC